MPGRLLPQGGCARPGAPGVGTAGTPCYGSGEVGLEGSPVLCTLKTDVAAIRTEVAASKAALTWRIVLAPGVFAALTRIMP